MDAATLVSLDEYLNTSYEPDVEFVDGVLVRRNAGTQLHGLLQIIVGSYLRECRNTYKIQIFTGTRLRIDANTGRHRIPDVMAVAVPYKKGKVVTDIPVIAIEIKSPDDTFDDIVGRCFDYEKLGVQNIVVMDPDNRRSWMFEHGDLRLVSKVIISLTVEQGTIRIPIDEMFGELDEE